MGRFRLVLGSVGLLAVAGGVGLLLAGSAHAAGSGVSDAAYTPIAPCVAFDTRTGTGTFAGPLAAGSAVPFQVTGTVPAAQGGGNTTCGVPAGAVSVHLNLVAIDAQGPGNLRADDGTTIGSGGIVNFAKLSPALNTQNAANLPLSTAGQMTVRVSSSAVQVRGIVLGYYTTALADKVTALQAQNTALEARLTAIETTLAGVTRSGTDLTFTGMNLHVINGAGTTDTTNGLGNLIIGYNENPNNVARTGSHDLIVGANNSWTSYGGAVLGYSNTISGLYSSVTGGQASTASGPYSSVSGGYNNTASNFYDSVSGGYQNTASGQYSSVSGGNANLASGGYSSVSGGLTNTASGIYSWLSGGELNKAVGAASAVSGGYTNAANNSWTSVSGGHTNSANDRYSAVSGGFSNQANGIESSVTGGSRNTASGSDSSVSGGNGHTAGTDFSWVAGTYSSTG